MPRPPVIKPTEEAPVLLQRHGNLTKQVGETLPGSSVSIAYEAGDVSFVATADVFRAPGSESEEQGMVLRLQVAGTDIMPTVELEPLSVLVHLPGREQCAALLRAMQVAIANELAVFDGYELRRVVNIQPPADADLAANILAGAERLDDIPRTSPSSGAVHLMWIRPKRGAPVLALRFPYKQEWIDSLKAASERERNARHLNEKPARWVDEIKAWVIQDQLAQRPLLHALERRGAKFWWVPREGFPSCPFPVEGDGRVNL